MTIREREYVKPLGEDSRRRLWISRDGRTILDYLVQLEVEVAPEEWKPIGRYDTRHGSPHRDQYNLSGKQRKQFLDVWFDIAVGYRDAVLEAEREIETNWKSYRQRFLKGEWPAR